MLINPFAYFLYSASASMRRFRSCASALPRTNDADNPTPARTVIFPWSWSAAHCAISSSPPPGMKIVVMPARLASASVRATQSSRIASVTGRSAPQSGSSKSAKNPFGVRSAPRPIAPSGGSGVSRPMPALVIALLFNQNLWPSAFLTWIGRVVSSRSRSCRVSGVPCGSIDSPKKSFASNRVLLPLSGACSGLSRQAWSRARIFATVPPSYPIEQSVGRVPWKWPSTMPGITIRPPRSITFVAGPAYERAFFDDPIKMMRPS
jgi:hypothetical protein